MRLDRLFGATVAWSLLGGAAAYSQVPLHPATRLPQLPAPNTYQPPGAVAYAAPPVRTANAGLPYQAGPQFNAPQFNAPQYNVPQYPGGQYSGAQYHGLQYQGGQYSGPATSGPQFNAPANVLPAGTVTRLPAGGAPTSLVGYQPPSNFPDPVQAPPANSVLTPPQVDVAPPTAGAPAYTSGNYGGPGLGAPPGVYGGAAGSGAVSGVAPGADWSQSGVAPYGAGGQAGMGYGGNITPIQAAPYGGGAATGGCATGMAGSSSTSSAGNLQPFANSDPSCGTGAGNFVGCNLWYAGAYGLVLTRDTQSHYTFSYDTGNESIQYTDAKDADVGYGGGYAAVIGRYFNCGQNSIEAVYWSWLPDDASVFTYGANAITDLNGILNWDSLTYDGLTMDNYVNDAAVHRLIRSNEAHNIELNVLSFSQGLSGMYGPSPVRFTWLVGVRHFRFNDNLMFSSDPTDTAFTGEDDEVHYAISTSNQLTGVQLGAIASYTGAQRLSLNLGTKFGLYGNQIDHTSHIYGAAGTATINNGPNAGRDFYVDNTKTDVSFLGEVFLGFGYCVNNRWSTSAGYRALAITGLAMPTDQIYADLRGINDLDTIESQSSLILHGAYFGAQYCF